MFIAVLLVGTASAQNRYNRQFESKSVTVDGTLKLERGLVAVASGDSVYFVPMLERYIGFIDGLKEGTNVSVEGYEFRNIIRPVKVTIDGKSYDFLARGDGFGRGRGPGFMGDDLRRDRNFGPGRGGRYNSRGGCCDWV